MGVSVEPELIKRLDAIRTENKLASMEELEKAVSGQGMNWEDFKSNIRSTLLTQRVISSEVGSHVTISDEEVTKYYEAHKSEFVRPEQVALREIVISTEGKKPEDLPDLKKKAETALKRVQDGEDFGAIAKRLSDGSTKSQGGFLGIYKRGELSKELEDKVFKMKRNELTEVMETKQGFLVLQVLEHYDEGEQSLAKVKNEIMDKLYSGRMEPAMREYLKTLREQSYVVILGIYKRGELSKELEDKVFKMKRNELTEVMETKQGFLVLQVLEHYDEGEQALAKVKNEIMDKLYSGRMEPAMREYLKTLREQSYVVIKPGFQDIAGGGGSEIQEVSATPEVSKQKKAHKKFLLFGKKPASGT